MKETLKLCLNCGKELKGRIDKKFCHDYCRNNYNNRQYSAQSNYVRQVNACLRKNRRILEALLTEGVEKLRVRKETLLEQGFSFAYYTQVYFTRKQQVYYFCYEYGYLPLDADWVLIVRQIKK